MPEKHPTIRFDHREIAVIFSLFIFVSLLMFTVGIVVGKGLAQAKYERLMLETRALTSLPAEPGEARITSVTTGPRENRSPDAVADNVKSRNVELEEASAKQPAEPLKLTPKETETSPYALRDGKAQKKPDALLDNPAIQKIVDDGRGGRSHSFGATQVIPDLPASFAAGTFTVQVGSYPSRKDAEERVATLKRLGFPHAYLSEKKFGNGQETWYRVWLGHYRNLKNAQKSGEILQKRGEVTNFLVRKSDSSG